MFEQELVKLADKKFEFLSKDLPCTTEVDTSITELVLLSVSINSCKTCTPPSQEFLKFKQKKKEYKIKYSKLLGTKNPKRLVKVVQAGRIEYYKANPDCAVYTKLEEAIYSIAKKFNIIFTITSNEPDKCLMNIVYDIKHKNIDPCVLSVLSVTQHIQKCGYTVSITEKECIFAYDILIKENKHCNLTFKEYQELLKRGWTKYAISQIYSANHSISPDGKKLHSLVSTYDLTNQLCFNSITTTGVGNAKLFLTEALKDIAISESLKQEIIDHE